MDILRVDKMEVYNFHVNILKVSLYYLSVLHCTIAFIIIRVVEVKCHDESQRSVLLYFVDGVANSDLVLLVTTRPTTGNTLAWAVACERDQWGRAIAGDY